MKDLTLESIVSRQQEIIASDIDGNTVMMSVDNGKYYGLDNIGSSIWLLLQKPVAVADLIDRLLEKFEVDRETCAGDVLTFLEVLRKDGLLKVESRS